MRVNRPEDESCFWHFQLAWTYFSGTPFIIDIYQCIWHNPSWYQRGIYDINRPFAFKSNPGFIFHESPGFETGDENQLQEVRLFMEKKAKANDLDDQLHAIWSISLSRRTYWPLMVSSVVKGFFWFWTMLGLYCRWNWPSLTQRGQAKVSITPSFKFQFPL